MLEPSCLCLTWDFCLGLSVFLRRSCKPSMPKEMNLHLNFPNLSSLVDLDILLVLYHTGGKKIKTKSRQIQQRSQMLCLFGTWIRFGNVLARGKIVHLVFTQDPQHLSQI